MLANTLYYRVTVQTTASGKKVGFNILAGFDPKVVFKTATYKESAALNLTTTELDTVVQKLAKHGQAASTTNCTAGSIQKFIEFNDEMKAGGLVG